MPEYQVFHQQAVKSFSAGEDNEHQRRWTESQWEAKASNKKFNYDKSRAHLNFEIVKGGKIVPLGSSKPILERFQDRLEATGAEDPNKGLETPKYRIACNMIFSGDADRMREMAFGDQNVERAKGADNSHVKRKSEIELWAKDIYKAVADAWSEDNIIDFSVHLDESSPHIHCLVTPIMYDEKKQKMRIKYRDTLVVMQTNWMLSTTTWQRSTKSGAWYVVNQFRLPMPSISLVTNGIDNSKPKAVSWKLQTANWNLTFAERKMPLRV